VFFKKFRGCYVKIYGLQNRFSVNRRVFARSHYLVDSSRVEVVIGTGFRYDRLYINFSKVRG
jgi:hypothetical protein